MIKRRPGREEIICGCTAYDHPHRLGGGDCTGSGWCASYREIDAFDCDSCNHSANGCCDIVTGVEELNNETCECVANEIRTGYIRDEYGFIPLDFSDVMEQKQREYYEQH